MARVKRGVIAGARHKKILKLAKGYKGARSRVFRVAKQAVIKAANGKAFRKRKTNNPKIARGCGVVMASKRKITKRA